MTQARECHCHVLLLDAVQHHRLIFAQQNCFRFFVGQSRIGFYRAIQQEPVVVLALGSEARNFSLSEFIHFWLTMIEAGLKRDIAELESGKLLPESNDESVREVSLRRTTSDWEPA